MIAPQHPARLTDDKLCPGCFGGGYDRVQGGLCRVCGGRGYVTVARRTTLAPPVVADGAGPNDGGVR